MYCNYSVMYLLSWGLNRSYLKRLVQIENPVPGTEARNPQ